MSVKFEGFEELEKKLKSFGDKGEEKLEEVIFDVATTFASNAKKNARAVAFDQGELTRSIEARKYHDGGASVVAHAYHAPYVEFGTGIQVSVPPEFYDIAREVQGRPKGDFQDGLENIRNWLRQHGSDERLAWVVLMSILRRGLKPRPFFYPAYLQAKKDLKIKGEKALKELINE